jgi:hypothetical protein
MTLVERLRALGKRREMEGNYTDQDICEAAAAQLEGAEAEIRHLKECVEELLRMKDVPV